MGVGRSPGRTQNEKCLKEPSRFGPERLGTQALVLVSFPEAGSYQSSMQESQRVGWRGSEEVRTGGEQLAAFCEKLEATVVRSHGAPLLVTVLALLPTCCVTFGKSLLTLGLKFFICKREGWTRLMTFK